MRSNRRTLIRYTLFQIPDLVLLGLALAAAVRWWGIPNSLAYTIFALWLVKDVVLYPVMRIAYQTGGSTADRLEGARGVAKEPLDPTGYVTVSSELWIAEVTGDGGPLPAGSTIRVVGLRGLTLLVEADVGEAGG